MRRLTERARIVTVLSCVLAPCVLLATLCSCEQLDARNRIRIGNRDFRDTRFIDAAAQYQRALKEVEHPSIHYNLGLAYSKIFKPGFEGAVLLGTQDEFVCQEIPGTKIVQAGACIKAGDRHYAECGANKTAPLEKAIAELEAQRKAATDEVKKKELELEIKDKQEELGRFTCPSSFKCTETSFCSLTSPELAELAAQNFQVWIKSQPSDDEIKTQVVEANKELEEAKKANNQSRISAAVHQVEELQTKDQTRKLMTQLWIDSEQHRKALDYWEGLLKDKPNDGEIMGNLAGINLKAGDWRKSIEWYNKVADAAAEPSSKVAALGFIGNVAWSKLNSKTLIGPEAIELADRGIGALQRGIEVQPKNPRLIGLQASIFNFRSTAHGASWAAAIDRATAQDLSKYARVLSDEAKKAQGQTPGAPAPGTPAAPAPAGTPAPGAAAPAPGGAAPPAAPAGTAPATTPPPATPPAPAGEKSGG